MPPPAAIIKKNLPDSSRIGNYYYICFNNVSINNQQFTFYEIGQQSKTYLSRLYMNIVTKGVFVSYQQKYQPASAALQAWLTIATKAEWKSPEDVKQFDPKASILKNGRVVFDIMGGKYRLVVRINYQKQWIYLRFFGTHGEYDKIDANTV